MKTKAHSIPIDLGLGPRLFIKKSENIFTSRICREISIDSDKVKVLKGQSEGKNSSVRKYTLIQKSGETLNITSRSRRSPGGFATFTHFTQHCPCHLAASWLSATTFFSFKYCMKISGTDHKTIVDFIFFVDNRCL
ncbi:hypothetical protein AVEN_18786-1 [Araneus ventricosus]|uniref:Uncharacterized protein n=1 Tax=Araneus ventricosus TaxID=182803 RepID=A0A4Y2X4V7_ARAVE|nr:hypothetical protein AVEN_18786-1 [Araneus ventricosus]